MCLKKIIVWRLSKSKPEIEVSLKIEVRKYDENNLIYTIKSLSLSNSVNKPVSLQIDIKG